MLLVALVVMLRLLLLTPEVMRLLKVGCDTLATVTLTMTPMAMRVLMRMRIIIADAWPM